MENVSFGMDVIEELLLKFFFWGGGRDQSEDVFFVKVGCVVVMCGASVFF